MLDIPFVPSRSMTESGPIVIYMNSQQTTYDLLKNKK